VEISAAQIKALREKTNAGVMDCKRALAEAGGDQEKAALLLRERGLTMAEKKAHRSTEQGLVECYIHAGGRIGAMIEVNCETDFVARNPDFQALVKDLAMHIAASDPLFIRKEDVPEEVLAKEREIFREQARATGKPEPVLDKIVEGRLSKFYTETCLLEQPFVKDPNITVRDHIAAHVQKIGENIQVRRFVRYRLGE
jgi:elongation factor Ts